MRDALLKHRDAMAIRSLRTFHTVSVVAVAVGFVVFSQFLRPADGFFGHHFTDVLAGFVLPCALLALPAFIPLFQTAFATFPGSLWSVFAAAVVWEVLVPLLDPQSVGDWRDVAAYLVGGAGYWFVSQTVLCRTSAGQDASAVIDGEGA